MKNTNMLCVVAVAAIAWAAWILPRSPAQEVGRPQAATELPSAVHKQLDALVGSWDVAARYTLGDREFEGTATCETKWILDGAILQQEYRTTMNGQPMTILQFIGYDQNKKKTFEIKLQSRETGVLHNEGTITEDAKLMTNIGEWTDPMSRASSRLRSVTTIVDRDRYTLEWFMTGADDKEEKRVTLTHTRRNRKAE